MDLSEKLFELRKNKNLTQDDVAEKLNVTRQTVSKWENGQSSPDFDKIAPLCDLYDVTPNEMFAEMEEFNKKDEKETFFKKEPVDYENMTKGQIRLKSAEIVSSSIIIFIAAIVEIIVGIEFLHMNEVLAVGIFLLLCGWGVARIIKHFMSVPKFEKTKEEKNEDAVYKQIKDIVGAIGLIIYFIISFKTMAWHITWIIFIIVGLINQIIKLVFLVNNKEVETDEK